ncbi:MULTISPECIES: hypothetical protein [Pseudomonas]|uniref:hypothetical protein n=1 Tax=Pseudomonas nitroreducens TaxID=46680 RepID=UPI001E46E8BE|nr:MULTISPECIES: hypothetical protein [Pseudomonas]MCE4073415.1 hypothetical protein [Pseudomonas nitritireducens]MCE4079711.1 hypothetical protein [Pseudomonas nitroreducens]
MLDQIVINGDDQTEDLNRFSRMIGLEGVASGRYSSYLLIQLYAESVLMGRLNPGRVIDEIQALEGLRESTTKAPTQFSRVPLKGLWHKHHTVDGIPSLAKNLKNALNRHGMPWFEQKIQEAKEAGEERYLSVEDVPALVDDIVSGSFRRRRAAKEFTGEWIVYAVHEGKNYYLCLGTHNTGDDSIRQQIDRICIPQFPFLKEILSPLD